MSDHFMEIIVTKNPSAAIIEELGCNFWPVWEKESSEFPWYYDEKETCLIVEGNVTVVPETGLPVSFGQGDLVVFPRGMNCVWQVHETVRKHYKFGE